MAAKNFREVLRQHLAHPATVSQVIKKLGSNFGRQMLGKGMCMAFAQRFVPEVGEPCSRCTQPLDRKTTLAYWIEVFVGFLNSTNPIHSTADLLDRTDYFLGYFLVREWDEEELHRMISKMEAPKMIIESGRATSDEDDWGDEDEEEYDDMPSALWSPSPPPPTMLLPVPVPVPVPVPWAVVPSESGGRRAPFGREARPSAP